MLMPSEIARLVLGYLKEIGCGEAVELYLTENRHLSEYLSCLRSGYEYPTSINGRSLLDILNEYSSLKRDDNANRLRVSIGGSVSKTDATPAATRSTCDQSVQTSEVTILETRRLTSTESQTVSVCHYNVTVQTDANCAEQGCQTAFVGTDRDTQTVFHSSDQAVQAVCPNSDHGIQAVSEIADCGVQAVQQPANEMSDSFTQCVLPITIDVATCYDLDTSMVNTTPKRATRPTIPTTAPMVYPATPTCRPPAFFESPSTIMRSALLLNFGVDSLQTPLKEHAVQSEDGSWKSPRRKGQPPRKRLSYTPSPYSKTRKADDAASSTASAQGPSQEPAPAVNLDAFKMVFDHMLTEHDIQQLLAENINVERAESGTQPSSEVFGLNQDNLERIVNRTEADPRFLDFVSQFQDKGESSHDSYTDTECLTLDGATVNLDVLAEVSSDMVDRSRAAAASSSFPQEELQRRLGQSSIAVGSVAPSSVASSHDPQSDSGIDDLACSSPCLTPATPSSVARLRLMSPANSVYSPASRFSSATPCPPPFTPPIASSAPPTTSAYSSPSIIRSTSTVNDCTTPLTTVPSPYIMPPLTPQPLVAFDRPRVTVASSSDPLFIAMQEVTSSPASTSSYCTTSVQSYHTNRECGGNHSASEPATSTLRGHASVKDIDADPEYPPVEFRVSPDSDYPQLQLPVQYVLSSAEAPPLDPASYSTISHQELQHIVVQDAQGNYLVPYQGDSLASCMRSTTAANEGVLVLNDNCVLNYSMVEQPANSATTTAYQHMEQRPEYQTLSTSQIYEPAPDENVPQHYQTEPHPMENRTHGLDVQAKIPAKVKWKQQYKKPDSRSMIEMVSSQKHGIRTTVGSIARVVVAKELDFMGTGGVSILRQRTQPRAQCSNEQSTVNTLGHVEIATAVTRSTVEPCGPSVPLVSPKLSSLLHHAEAVQSSNSQSHIRALTFKTPEKPPEVVTSSSTIPKKRRCRKTTHANTVSQDVSSKDSGVGGGTTSTINSDELAALIVSGSPRVGRFRRATKKASSTTSKKLVPIVDEQADSLPKRRQLKSATTNSKRKRDTVSPANSSVDDSHRGGDDGGGLLGGDSAKPNSTNAGFAPVNGRELASKRDQKTVPIRRRGRPPSAAECVVATDSALSSAEAPSDSKKSQSFMPAILMNSSRGSPRTKRSKKDVLSKMDVDVFLSRLQYSSVQGGASHDGS